ncbi:MAG: HNH endonuclease [Leptospirales bacterium]|nr:HNH endonuclease [Leptospirales bacterium]
MRRKNRLTQEQLKKVVTYDPETGIFTRIAGRNQGPIEPKPRRGGYVFISIHRQLQPAHRLAWLYMTGAWPLRHIKLEHKNKNKLDNAWTNIAEAACLGMVAVSHRDSWLATISVRGKRKKLGLKRDPEEARKLYEKAVKRYRGAEYAARMTQAYVFHNDAFFGPITAWF